MSACRHRRQRTPTFPSPTHQDPRNAPSHRSFPDARGRADLDPLNVTEGDANSSSKREPQPPRYTIFLSTPHGVLNDSGTDRYSITYFHSPNPDSVIECLPSCVSADTPARYPPAVYRDLVLEFYRANYFHQKGHRSEAAALAGAAAE